jgi:ABC-type multidrug transport system ATPase subunit
VSEQGKTTTLRMMLGPIRRDAGSITLFGSDPARDWPLFRRRDVAT